MKVIVDVPEDVYYEIQDNEEFVQNFPDRYNTMILNGIPLDKIVTNIEKLKHKNTDVSGYRWWNNALDNALCEIRYETEDI